MDAVVHRPEGNRAGSEAATTARSVALNLVMFAVATLSTFVLYLRTMAPTVYGLDSAELTAGAYLLGIVHAPGSPTFLLLGHLFTWLPFGDVGYRVNLVSATTAALAVGFVYGVLWQLTRLRLQSLAGAWLLATTYYFWISAVAAELYALHAAFITGLLWLALRWRERQQPAMLLTFGLLFGIGLGNHLTLAVLAPGFLILVAAGFPSIWRRPGLLAAAAGCVAAGWCVYLYLPLRAAAGVEMNYARDFGVDVTTWRGFWWMVTGSMFDNSLFGVPLRELPAEAVSYFYRLWSNFVGFGCLIAPIGLAADFHARPQIHKALMAMFAGHLLFVLTYDVGDKELMLLPTFIIWAMWTALGAGVVARFISERSAGAVAVSGAMLLLIMAAGNLILNYGRVDISQDWSARNRGEVLLSWLPVDALYLATWADAPILDYLRLVEGQRPDLTLSNVFLERGSRREALVERHLEEGKPVYATARVALKDRFYFDYIETCDCFRVLRRPLPACIAPAAELQRSDAITPPRPNP